MTGTTSEQETGQATPRDSGRAQATRRRIWIAVGAVLAVVAIVAGLVVADPFRASTTPSSDIADNTYPTSTTAIVRRNLTSQTEVAATLGFSGSYTVINQARGTITSLPKSGRVVVQGHVLYRVNDLPVILLYGSTPAYRTLAEGKTADTVTGSDVAELNADLVALGYATTAEIPSGSDEFTWWTKQAVEALQAHLGLTQTGALTFGTVVFLPTAARITSLGAGATLGAPAPPGSSILSASSTGRVVTVQLDTAQQSEVAVGDTVMITLPNNRTTPGRVSSVGTVASNPSGNGNNGGSGGSGGSGTTVNVLVTPDHPAATGDWDQAPVDVTITTGHVRKALVVPVDALLALAGGGYAVEVVSAKGVHSLEAVTLGLFDDADGLVQVSGPALAAGQRVVVPAA